TRTERGSRGPASECVGGPGPPTPSFGEVSPERDSTGRAKADGAKPPDKKKGGVTVRRLGTRVGMIICLLAISPPLWAQGAGAVTVAACAPCHGAATAAAQATPTFPKLDGQHAAYLDKQLREYKSGKRKSAIMAPIIAALKKDQISGMAKHFASQTPARGAVENPQLAGAGKVLYGA